MQYAAYPKGTVIMAQGEPSNEKLYIIIKGQCAVFQIAARRYDEEEPEREDEPHGHLENILREREDGFGEQALLMPPELARRNATVIAKTNVELIVLDRESFLKVQEVFSKDFLDKQRVLLQLIPCFTLMSLEAQRRYFYHFQVQVFSQNEFVFREGENSDRVYILKEGKANFTKLDQVNSAQQINVSVIDTPQLCGQEVLERGTYAHTLLTLSKQASFYVISHDKMIKFFPKEVAATIQEDFRHSIDFKSEVGAIPQQETGTPLARACSLSLSLSLTLFSIHSHWYPLPVSHSSRIPQI